jgi:UDP-N-acetylmuramoyl-tripeptide--D-alanyl-D-alanine ligase
MFELGTDSMKEHEGIVKMLSNSNVHCYFVGTFYRNKIDKTNFFFYETFENFQVPLNTKLKILPFYKRSRWH